MKRLNGKAGRGHLRTRIRCSIGQIGNEVHALENFPAQRKFFLIMNGDVLNGRFQPEWPAGLHYVLADRMDGEALQRYYKIPST
jgi:hypothetical protein